MSSIQRTTATTHPEPATHKKKFGKNLNKLTKPPAPPVANAGSRQNTSSRNGLLLLSTKRTASASATTGGLLSGKSRTTDATGGSTLTNDALLSAAMGASRGDAATQGAALQQPDAWGVAEKQHAAPEAPQLAPKGGVSSGYHQNAAKNEETTRNRPSEAAATAAAPRYEQRRSRFNDGDYPPEYARDRQPRSDMGGGGDDEQLAYMSRLARERSERRRNEEDARMREQKDRATKRLKELEGKMSNSDVNDSRAVHNPAGVPLSIVTPKPPVVLERLGRTKSGKEADGRVPPAGDRGMATSTTTTRTLFDPNRTDTNRTYSSLVGGNAAQNNDRLGARDDNSPRPETTPDHRGLEGLENPNNEEIFQLSSYEDRDRGERNNAAGPRMLFDPKSGSMVAVKSRDDAATGGRRKERGKAKGRNNSKESPGKLANDVAAKPSRRAKGRKEMKRGDSEVSDTVKSSRRGKNKQTKRLPRTCGVLYVRDENGRCVCADGCDGDEGYGSHSVPGGRLLNPEAHARFLEQRQEHAMYDEAGNYGSAMNYLEEMQPYDAGMDTMGGYSSGPSLADTPMTPQKVDWVKPNEKIELVTGVDDSPTLQATANPWAPSEAALAAAKKSTEKKKPVDVMKSPPRDPLEDHDDGDDDGPAFIGLGFDPTENMDSVMRSPTNVHSRLKNFDDKFDDVGLTSLALDSDDDAAARNIFAFGDSTWGSSGAGRLSTWTGLGEKKEDAFGTAAAQDADDKEKTGGGTSSFLSLSSLSVNQESSTWGTTGLNGLGGAALPSAHASDHGAD